MMWLLLLAALQVADWLTTRMALKDGGSELNPVIRALIRVTGNVDLALIGKGIAIVALGYLIWTMGPSYKWVLIALCGFYGLVVLWNVRQAMKA